MNQNNWKYPNLAKITTAGILILVLIIGLIAIDISYGKYNEIKTFYPPNLQKGYVATVYEYANNGTLLNQASFPRELIVAVSLETTSLSAQNMIKVTGITEPLQNISSDELEGMPNTLILIFPSAIHQPTEFVSTFSPNYGFVKIYWNSDTKRYEGTDNIMYQFQSDGGFFLATPENIGGEHTKEETITKHDDGTETRHLTLEGDLRELIYEPSKFPVEPVSTTDNMKMNNVIQAFSILVIAIGLIQTRNKIIHGVFWCFDISKMIKSKLAS